MLLSHKCPIKTLVYYYKIIVTPKFQDLHRLSSHSIDMCNNCSLLFLLQTTTTIAPPPPPPSCFPSMAKIKLENGVSITMSELQVGDQVQTGNEIILFH